MKTPLSVITVTIALLLGSSSLHATIVQHERLRSKNTFNTPEEVVAYYCARDASGFVWSGLLDAEVRAFTSWKEAPQHDVFYIAKNYEINPQRVTTIHGNQADVEVRYTLVALGDANNTRIPVNSPELRVVFNLRKTEGVWKIDSPAPQDLTPVVLESKFPVASR